MTTGALTAVSGTIKRYSASGSGVVLNEGPNWYNFSSYPPASDVPRPAVGTAVQLEVDERRYIHSLVPLDAPHAAQPQATTAVASRDAADVAGALSGDSRRDMLIIRQSCLKTAAELYGDVLNQSPERLAEVVATAEYLEAWVLR